MCFLFYAKCFHKLDLKFAVSFGGLGPVTVNLDIRSKYIYSAFLMIYLSVFIDVIVVVFPFFGASKDLIAQDNMSKRAAVEKEPPAFQKDNEGQNSLLKIKIVFSLLDMKLENRDTNIAKPPNFPKFSKLYDIGNPLRLFKSFVHDALVDMIANNTKL